MQEAMGNDHIVTLHTENPLLRKENYFLLQTGEQTIDNIIDVPDLRFEVYRTEDIDGTSPTCILM